MHEVSVDSLQQQVRTFWGESLEVRVFLWGVASPPTRVTLTRASSGVSPSHPLCIYSSLFSYAVSSGSIASSPSPPGWPYLFRMAALQGSRGLFRRLRSPSPLPLPLMSPFPLPPLRPSLTCPLAPWIFQACCGSAGVWPLCGPTPRVRFMIWATMARACSSGAPLPPYGRGAPTSPPDSPLLLPPTSAPSPNAR